MGRRKRGAENKSPPQGKTSSRLDEYLRPTKRPSRRKPSQTHDEYYDENEEWKDKLQYRVLMLPHQKVWEWVAMTCVVFHIQLAFAMLSYAFPPATRATLQYVHYLFECIYVLFLFFRILHRTFSIHKQDPCYKRMPFPILTLGSVSLLPLYELQVNVMLHPQDDRLEDLIRLKVLLRGVHVFLLFSRAERDCGKRRIHVAVLKSLAVTLFCAGLLTGVLEHLACYGCATPNWTRHLAAVRCDPRSARDRLVFGFAFAGGLLVTRSGGVLMPETAAECACVVLATGVALALRLHLLGAHVVPECIRGAEQRLRFRRRLGHLRRFLGEQRLPGALQAAVADYYDVLWQRRAGVQRMPPAFRLLPTALQKDVMADVHWDALAHAQLFRDERTPTRRSLARLMAASFRARGDSVLRSGEPRAALVYVESGVVQLLSPEDDASPLMSFSAGSAICELALLVVAPSASRLRCATHCELRVLSHRALYRGVGRQVACVRRVRARLAARVERARRDCARAAHAPPAAVHAVKRQWQDVAAGRQMAPLQGVAARHLDLYALADDVNLKLDAVCLTGGAPLVLHPHSSFRALCRHAALAACVAEAVVVPLQAAFARHLDYSIAMGLLLLDAVYWLDVYVQLTTALAGTAGTLDVRAAAIALRRIKQLPFLVDVAAAAPVDYVYYLSGCEPRVFLLWKLPRVLKIYRLVSFVGALQDRADANTLFVYALKYLLLAAFTAHFATCLLYAITCYEPSACHPFSWIMQDDAEAVHPMLRSALYLLDIFVAGQQSMFSYTVRDVALAFAVAVASYYFCAFGVGELAAILFWRHVEEARFGRLRAALRRFLQQRSVAPEVAARAAQDVAFRWRQHGGLFERSATELLAKLPPPLRLQLRHHLVGDVLLGVPLFQLLPPAVGQHAVEVALALSYPQGAIVCAAGDEVDWLYVVRRGCCRLTSTLTGDRERHTTVRLMAAGECFPLIEGLHRMPAFLTVTAETAVDVVALPYDRFLAALHLDRQAAAMLERVLRQHARDNKEVFLEKELHYDEVRTRPGRKASAYFTYQVDDNYRCGKEEAALSWWRTTIDPHHRYYIVYEILRCCVVVFQYLILVFQLNVLYAQRDAIQYLHILCDLLAWADILVRLHLQYYREDTGALVSDFGCAYHRYLRHAFVLDVYAACPISTISADAKMWWAHPVVAKHWALLLSRPLQLYRVFLGLAYWCRMRDVSEATIARLLCALFVAAALPLAANCLALCVCDIDFESVACPVDMWHGSQITNITATTALVHYTYVFSAYLVGTAVNQYATRSNAMYLMYLVTSVLGVSLAWMVTANLTSLMMDGEHMRPELQNDRRDFAQFARQEDLGRKLSDRLLSFHQRINKSAMHCVMGRAERLLSPQVLAEVCHHLYHDCLRRCKLLQLTPISVQRSLSVKFERAHFFCDDFLVRTNDVNHLVFIVQEGVVEISMAGARMAVLGKGGMFGCIAGAPRMRQTIAAIAKQHTSVLCMPSHDLLKHLGGSGAASDLWRLLVRQGLEYVPKSSEVRPTTSMLLSSGVQSRYQRIRLRILGSRRRLYLFHHLMDMQLAPASVLLVLVLQLLAMHDLNSSAVLILLYSLDAIFLAKMAVSFVCPYVVGEVVVTEQRQIARRYLKGDFGVDLCALLAPEVLFGALVASPFARALLASNRFLRLFHLLRHYWRLKGSEQVTRWTRCAFVVHVVLIYAQACVNVWNYTACYGGNGRCRFRRVIAHAPAEYRDASSSALSCLLAYHHVVSCIAGVGQQATRSLSLAQIGVTSAIMASSVVALAALHSSFAHAQIVDGATLRQFTNALNALCAHMARLQLSPLLVDKMADYLRFVWRAERGRQMPALMDEGNRCLRERVMLTLYGDLVAAHPLFARTHRDFVRQAVMQLKRCVFPHSAVLVQQFDVDEKMYFIQSGRVNVVDAAHARVVGVLNAGDAFGELQCMRLVPHEFTYIAMCTVRVATFKKCHWEYLLPYFPASHNEIKYQLFLLYHTTMR